MNESLASNRNLQDKFLPYLELIQNMSPQEIGRRLASLRESMLETFGFCFQVNPKNRRDVEIALLPRMLYEDWIRKKREEGLARISTLRDEIDGYSDERIQQIYLDLRDYMKQKGIRFNRTPGEPRSITEKRKYILQVSSCLSHSFFERE